MAVGAAIAIIGLGMGVASSRKQARAARRQGKRERALAEIQAKSVLAAGSHAAQEELRQARLLESRGLALAAASGAGASDPTTVKILSDISGEGAYRAASALYEAEAEARMVRLGGEYQRQSANDRARGIEYAGAADAVAGVGSMYNKYGRGGPDSSGGDASGTSGGTYT